MDSGRRTARPWAGAVRRQGPPKRIVLPKKVLPRKTERPVTKAAAPDTSWGPVADWYRDLLYGQDETFQQTVIQPNLRRILGLRPGSKLLDLACGPGFFSRSFARLGVEVMGIDISKELISAADEALRRDGTDVAERAQFRVAEADRIDYRVASGQIEMTGNVTVRRGEDVFTGNVLQYDLDDRTLKASGDESGDGRIHAVIQPAKRSADAAPNP